MCSNVNSQNGGNIVDWFCDTLKQKNCATDKITINLEKQEIKCGEKTFYFDIDKAKKYKIINQIDTIGEILKKIKLIEEFEKSHEI